MDIGGWIAVAGPAVRQICELIIERWKIKGRGWQLALSFAVSAVVVLLFGQPITALTLGAVWVSSQIAHNTIGPLEQWRRGMAGQAEQIIQEAEPAQ